jgi:acyl-CoA synthetase (AMP-forming)/AMP-acid ligase II
MFVSVNSSADLELEGSVGLLLSGVEVEVRDPNGVVLPPNQQGDIWLYSSYILAGYLSADDLQLVSALSENGWLDTGDIGRVDVDGHLFITGRRKDLIIHGGTNVSPRQVEDVLLKCPGVKDVAVVGVSHPFWVEEVLAFLIPEPGVLLDEKALYDFCGESLNSDAVPSRFIFIDSFPQSGNGKIQKHILRKNIQT